MYSDLPIGKDHELGDHTVASRNERFKCRVVYIPYLPSAIRPLELDVSIASF